LKVETKTEVRAGQRLPASHRLVRASEKTEMEKLKIQINLKWMMAALVAVAVLATGPIFASARTATPEQTAYLSERASMPLAEIQEEAAQLGPHAKTFGTFARNPKYSWQSHAFYLERVKGHMNAGERTAELQQIRDSVLPCQQQAIREVVSHAAQVAASTQAC
jgi:hypothetical protein